MSDFKLDMINNFLKENEMAFTRGTGKINISLQWIAGKIS